MGKETSRQSDGSCLALGGKGTAHSRLVCFDAALQNLQLRYKTDEGLR
jgi:hypothetical protein